jgi:putative PIN family toxin of toxin-antitoxin system
LRFVFDTNVLVSALLLTDSIPRRAFDRALTIGKVLLSFATLAELNGVLGREQFRKYVSLEDVRRFLAALVREAEWIEVKSSISACRDPKDNMFLELAVDGRASHLITGDADLLCLNPFRSVAVLTPQAFLEFSLPPRPVPNP